MTLLGLISDTHGREAVAREAMRALRAAGVDLVLHLGDVGSVDVLEALVEPGDGGDARSPPPVQVVFGNTDYAREALAEAADRLGIEVRHPVGRLLLDRKVIVFQHGDDYVALRRALDAGVDYLCHGHTHVPRDQRSGRTRILNPGALYRSRRLTAGILDPLRDDFRLIEIPRPGGGPPG